MSMTLALAAAAVLIILPAVASELINFKPCDGAPANIDKVDISPCSVQPCKFQHNISATVTIWFKSVVATNTLTTKIYGIVGGLPIPFANPHPNACEGDNIACPVKKDQSYKYISSLYVNPSYPSLKLVVRWMLTGDSDATEVCFNFPMEIDNGNDVPIATVIRQQISMVDSEKPLDVKDKPLDVKDKSLDVKDKSLDVKGKPLDVKDKSLDVKDKSLDVKDKSLDVKDKPSVPKKGEASAPTFMEMLGAWKEKEKAAFHAKDKPSVPKKGEASVPTFMKMLGAWKEKKKAAFHA